MFEEKTLGTPGERLLAGFTAPIAQVSNWLNNVTAPGGTGGERPTKTTAPAAAPPVQLSSA